MIRMRSILVLVLLLAIGAVVYLALRGRATTAEPSSARDATANESARPANEPTAIAAPEAKAERASVASSEDVKPVESAPDELAQTATLEVLVVAKETGAPLEKVRVSLVPKDGGAWLGEDVDRANGSVHDVLITGGDGLATFEVPTETSFTLNTLSKLGGPSTAQLEVAALAKDEHRSLRVELLTRDDLHFFGRVVATDGGSPIAGASIVQQVDLRSVGVERDSPDPNAKPIVTGADGIFELSAASWRPRTVRIEAHGYGRALVQTNPSHPTVERAQVVKLANSAELDVLVRDSSGATTADLELEASTEGYELAQRDLEFDFYGFGKHVWNAKTDASGRATILELPANVPLAIGVAREKKKLRDLGETITLKPGEQRALTIDLAGGAEVVGRLLDDDEKPIASREIWLVTQRDGYSRVFRPWVKPIARATSGDDGAFVLSNIAAGSWFVGVAPPSIGATLDLDALGGLAEPVSIDATATRVEVVLHASRGLTIRGKVLTPDGAPLANANVNANHLAATSYFNAKAGADGEFTIGPLARGDYRVSAADYEHFAESDPIVVKAGARELVLRVKLAGSIRGRVVDADGALARASIKVLPTKIGEGAFVEMEGEAPQGTFEFKALVPTRYEVLASSTDGWIAHQTVDVVAGGAPNECTLELKRGATIRVHYLGPKPVLFVDFSVDGVSAGLDSVDKDGEHTFTILPGHVTLTTKYDAKETGEAQTFDVAAGETKSIEVGKAE